jgi:hypothetical protein
MWTKPIWYISWRSSMSVSFVVLVVGKSLTVSTLEAYFRGKKALFEGLKVAELESEWKEYPVLHIDFNGEVYQQEGALERKLRSYVSRWEQEYGITTTSEVGVGERFAAVIRQANEQSGQRVVVLVDEYDKPMLDVIGTPLEEVNREILRGFYSVFKLVDAHLRFVLLTGVTKFSQVSVFSGFNQPYDISMSADYEALCGITEQELHSVLGESVAMLATKMTCSVDDAYRMLKTRYDGYHYSPQMTDVYNPFSLFYAFSEGYLGDYWFSTGTPSYLIKLLSDSKLDMEQLLKGCYAASYFVDYRANTEDPLAMLYQSGYLTIKEVLPQEDGTLLYRLDYPNIEVKRGFVTMLCNNYFASREDAGGVAQKMVCCLIEHRLDDMRVLLDQYLSSIDYEMRKDKEYHFQYTLYLIFSLMSSFGVSVERHTSQGRSDLIVETSKYVYIFEFKLDGTAEEALKQIEDKQYAKPYLTDSRPVTKIGVSFGRKSGTIDEWKVG